MKKNIKMIALGLFSYLALIFWIALIAVVLNNSFEGAKHEYTTNEKTGQTSVGRKSDSKGERDFSDSGLSGRDGSQACAPEVC